MTRIVFEGKLANETTKVAFDFSTRLAVGETISSSSTTAAVYSGTDASPSAIISGSVAISGGKCTQAVTGGVLGTVYKLLCTANTSASQILQLAAFLAIVPDTE